ncbi:MAG: benzoyl-CoA reductase subunit C [Pseudomonadales bacterium]|nr:benzoyl-CoA reductase subunit C [Halioglobus sp.]MCP5194634.1 benzoyl-CoA reductase subunit C [Pseudomonadales bacterium]
MSTQAIIERCEALHQDMNFTAAREWKAAAPGRHVIGHLPIYVPRELIHAAGMLPLGIYGGGDNMEVVQGDAYYQSYICRIPRSTMELALSGRLDFVDGMLFPSICDVIRNLSGVWKLNQPDLYVRYVDLPQNYQSEVGGTFYIDEMREVLEGLEAISGRKVSNDDLLKSIVVYNRNRDLIRELYRRRVEKPWNVPVTEVYLLMRAGMVLPVEEHNQMLVDYMAAIASVERPQRDNSRVILNGMFCEQPPLNLIRSIELSGCYVVDDDFILINRWLRENVEETGDALLNLSEAFLDYSVRTSATYEPSRELKGQQLLESVRNTRAEGVIFAAPSFCDPALLEQPMLVDVLNDHGIPNIQFKYAENTGQMQPIREQAGTFADSIKLWS